MFLVVNIGALNAIWAKMSWFDFLVGVFVNCFLDPLFSERYCKVFSLSFFFRKVFSLSLWHIKY